MGRKVAEQLHLGLRVVYLKSPGEWVHEREGLAFLFLESGEATFTCGRKTERLSPGDVVISSGGRGGRLSVADGENVVFRAFSLGFEHLFPLFAAEEIALLDEVTESLTGFRVYPASDAVAQECHRLLKGIPSEFNLDHRSQLLCVAAVILTAEFDAARKQRVGFPHTEKHAEQVLRALSAEDVLNCSVDELAAKFSCTRRHLNRLFHEYFGFSAAALRMEMRMMKAASLVRNPGLRIIDIAEQCGFNHLGLFNTCFKKRFGISPGQWRKQDMAANSSSSRALASTVCPLGSGSVCLPSGIPEFPKALLILPAPQPAPAA